MLFREDKVARADAEAIRKGVGFYLSLIHI